MSTRRVVPILSALVLPLLLAMPQMSGAQEKDPDTGFVIAKGWDTVKDNCTACHSARMVTQNSGTRNHWESLIRWMQDTQGLWQFPPETETEILDYLAQNYGPKEGMRRPPIPRELMPENPYRPKTVKSDSGSGSG